MSSQKISFSFNKIQKPSKIVTKPVKAIDFIECLEEQTIRTKKVELDNVKKELVIQLPIRAKPRTATPLKAGAAKEENANGPSKPMDDLEQRAIRNILDSVNEEKSNITRMLEIKAMPFKNDGAAESSIEDYERIPIAEFGLGLLRGMGYTPETKSTGKQPEIIQRPKGLGLGADNPNDRQSIANKQPPLVKNAHVRVICGKHKHQTGKVLGFDEDTGRVVVKLADRSDNISIDELMLRVVEPSKNSK